MISMRERNYKEALKNSVIQTKEWHNKRCHLLLLEEDEENLEFATKCDGCGAIFEKGDKFISDIESCCGGGCVRSLCKMCIDYSHELLKGEIK